MKYMGSKRLMLQNGLGETLAASCVRRKRFVDIFSGSGIVAWHIASRFNIETVAVDLQRYSKVLAEAVLSRTITLDCDTLWRQWFSRASSIRAPRHRGRWDRISKSSIADMRTWAAGHADWPVLSAYGGYYYHPDQALWIDRLRMSIPVAEPARAVALASLISAGSMVAASPGHTAQPLRLKRSSKPFITEAWNKNVPTVVKCALERICAVHALVPGYGVVGDAGEFARELSSNDLVFLDPPYAGVQYSRFYHVLETIATGGRVEVEGAGRYPNKELRPRSRFSTKSTSETAMRELLSKIAERGAAAVMTFPDAECSNGLSGERVRSLSEQYFHVDVRHVESHFSTLGGRKLPTDKARKRRPRLSVRELIFVLNPK